MAVCSKCVYALRVFGIAQSNVITENGDRNRMYTVTRFTCPDCGWLGFF